MNKSSLRSPELLALSVLILLGLLAALVGFKARFHVEASNKRVELVVDYMDALNLALASREPLNSVLQQVKSDGITSLALTEDTVDSLRTAGAITVVDEGPYETTFRCAQSEPSVESRFEQALANKTAIDYTEVGDEIKVAAPYLEVSQLGLGLDPAQVSTTVRNGLHICPRLNNFPGANAQSIEWMLQSVKEQCGGEATTLIFTGLDVLGNRNALRDTATALHDTGLRYGSVEFGKQIGDDVLSRVAADDTVRVHSIGGNEMPTMDIPTAIGRFGLAARERSIRVCYIRFFIGGENGEPDILKTNKQFINSIRSTLEDGGLSLGPAHPYAKDPLPGKFILIIMGFAVAAGGLLLIRVFTGLTGVYFWGLLVAAILASTFLATRHSTPVGREALALGAAMCFPTLGLLLFKSPGPNSQPQSPVKSLLSAISQYFLISAATGIGIALVVGLLADRLFMLKVYEFAGIRVAVFTPILLTALYYGLHFDSLPEDATWKDRRESIVQQYHRMMSSPLLVGQVILGVIGLAIVGVILLRSGNDPGIGVSTTELGFRRLLNEMLKVRPRTKEFLFGHPMLIMGLALAYSGRRKPLPLFLLAAAIGQASLLNTFCHIHTPLTISVLRAMIGLVLGGAIGSVAYLLLQRFIRPDYIYKLVME